MCAIGTKIRKLRIAHNLSQPELSKMLDISQSSLCSIESGDRKKIDFSLIQKICIIFNKDLNYFNEVSSLKFDADINVLVNNKVVTGAVTNIISQINIIIEDNEQKLKIIEVLEDKLNKNTKN